MHTKHKHHIVLVASVIIFTSIVLAATALLSVNSLRAFLFGIETPQASAHQSATVLRADYPPLP